MLGSELEAALEELRLIRELRPPANARGKRGGRGVYLRRRGARWSSRRGRGRSGRSGADAAPSARRGRSRGATEAELAGLLAGAPLPRLRARLRDLSDCLRYEDAARLRDRIQALEQVIRELAALGAPPALEACLLDARLRRGLRAGGLRRRAAAWPTPGRFRRAPGPCSRSARASRAARAAEPSFAPEDAEELLLARGFIRRPPPELAVLPLDERAILAAVRDPAAAA